MPRRTLNRAFWVRYRGEIGYMIGLVGVAFALWGQHQNTDAIRVQAQAGSETHAAVCALRHDLSQRAASSQAFLVNHPNGFAGVTVKVIRASIANERKTIQALAALRCP